MLTVTEVLLGHIGSGQYGFDQAVMLIVEQTDNDLTRSKRGYPRPTAGGAARQVDAQAGRAHRCARGDRLVQALLKSPQEHVSLYDTFVDQAEQFRKAAGSE
jgi:hypothetical protein